ncbi:MAG: tripartite tricarboxylate transporter substrate-binding protein [Xanthobacteraceae bacterium]
MFTRLGFLMMALCVIALAAPVGEAHAQWPERTIRLLITTPAGGSPDYVGRLVADKLSERLGKTIVVENTNIQGLPALNSVVRASADGYLFVVLTGGVPTLAALQKTMPFSLETDLTMITFLVRYPMVVAVANESPYKTLGELIAASKARPEGLTFAMNLPGSLHHFVGELINIEAKSNLRGIPYRGSTQMHPDLLAGRVDAMIDTGTSAIPQVLSGAMRGLAVSSPDRFPLAPEIPAISETIKGVAATSWLGLAGPPGLPKEIVERMNKEVREIMELPDIREKLAKTGNVPMVSTPEDMRTTILKEVAQWQRVVAEKNIERR